MEITIYAKKRQTADGKSFYSFLSRLTKKDGEVITVTVKFRESCGIPDGKSCPMNIRFDRKDANYTVKAVELADGSPAESRILWISDWEEGSPYVDNSMDEFED